MFTAEGMLLTTDNPRIGGAHGKSFAFYMAALWYRAGHYIFALWFLSFYLLLSFHRLISAAADWMSTILPHMVWP